MNIAGYKKISKLSPQAGYILKFKTALPSLKNIFFTFSLHWQLTYIVSLFHTKKKLKIFLKFYYAM